MKRISRCNLLHCRALQPVNRHAKRPGIALALSLSLPAVMPATALVPSGFGCSRLTSQPSMHVRELAELAALIAVHWPSSAHTGGPTAHGINEEYWSASKCRLDRWSRLLRQLTAATDR